MMARSCCHVGWADGDRRRAKNDAMRDQVIVGPLGASALFGGSVENRIAYGIACD